MRKFQHVIINEGQVFKWIYRNGLIFVDRLPRDNRDKLNFQVTTSTRSYFFSKISARDNKLKSNFSSHINKTTLFLGKCYLAIIRAVRIFDWIPKICQFFEKISVCDNKNSKFQIASTKLFFWGKSLPRDNRDSLNFQVTSSKLSYFLQKLQLLIIGVVQFSNHFIKYWVFCENFKSRLQGQLKFSSECMRLNLF